MIIDLLINGTAFSGTISLIADAIIALKSQPVSINGPLYDTEYRKVNMDDLTITYKRLPEEEEENLKNNINIILSGIVTMCAWFLEFIVKDNNETESGLRIVGSILVGVILFLFLDILKKVISCLVISGMNMYAKKKGLVKKISGDIQIIG